MTDLYVSEELPPVRPSPCDECPWRRISMPGWLGPMSPEEWVALAQSDLPVGFTGTVATLFVVSTTDVQGGGIVDGVLDLNTNNFGTEVSGTVTDFNGDPIENAIIKQF